jgi:hypothetical protein
MHIEATPRVGIAGTVDIKITDMPATAQSVLSRRYRLTTNWDSNRFRVSSITPRGSPELRSQSPLVGFRPASS